VKCHAHVCVCVCEKREVSGGFFLPISTYFWKVMVVMMICDL